MNGPRAGLAAFLALLVLPAGPSVSALLAAGSDPCAAPAELSAIDEPLPNVRRAVETRASLRILVVGTGSSTWGGAAGPAGAYPQLLAGELRRRLPEITVTMEVQGGRGLAATDLLALLAGGLAEFHPDLVIWQTGTVDAVKGDDIDDFAAALRTGIERAAAARADVILMDQQFSRLARAAVNYTPYRQAIEAVANATDATLLRRYELMRYWAESGQIDLDRASRRDWQGRLEQLHTCLARALAGVIAADLREAKH